MAIDPQKHKYLAGIPFRYTIGEWGAQNHVWYYDHTGENGDPFFYSPTLAGFKLSHRDWQVVFIRINGPKIKRHKKHLGVVK